MKKIIDTHTHINHGVPNDTKVSEIYRSNLDELRELALAAGIDKMFASTFASVLTAENVAEENEYMYELSKSVDYLYQWVVIEPRCEETFRQARRMLESKKCVGIKIHPFFHKYSYREFGDRIFSLADELGAVLLIHPVREDIVPYADKYSNATFITAHLGGTDFSDTVERCKNGNIYTDIATCASVNNYVLEYTVNRVGSERILFGTDTYAPGSIRGRVEYAPISDKDKENILYNNAERLFARWL